MLPFLKDRQEGAMASPVEIKKREPDEDQEYGMLDAIAEDMIEALHKKDKKLMKEAIEALIEHIKDEDEEQDEESEK